MDSYKEAAAAAGGGGGAGEVRRRRIDVVYFLSRGGRTDHPHLFRVNHHSGRAGGGVRLRDVKRWLSEIRGRDMPDNFSWSYKRKYKAGYVWQDLKDDDDLITPVSDNEYVLKGCDDVRGTPPRCVQPPTKTHSLLADERKRHDDRDEKTTGCGDLIDRSVDEVVVLTTPDDDESSPKPPPPQPADDDDQDSPGSSEVLFNVEDVSRSQDLRRRRGQQSRRRPQGPVVKAAVVARAVLAEWQPPAPEEQQDLLQGAVAAAKARRMRVARALHNILTCGAAAADADDAALRPVARRQRRSAAEAGGGDDWTTPPTCPGMDGCGLRGGRKTRSSRRGGNEQQQQGKRDGGKRDGRDAHKPVALPRCSQCGKEFKPQDLHSHMQSCRGFKERMRSNNNTGSRASVDSSRNSNSYSAAGSAEYTSKHDGHCSQEPPSSASAVLLLTGS